MFEVCLDDNPQYEALSYAWGKLEFRRLILLNGSPHEITDNLDRSLRRLRQPNRTLTLWIDALCINQSSPEERTHQVKMMGSIFSRAANVFLFIGDYTEGHLLPGSDSPAALSIENGDGDSSSIIDPSGSGGQSCVRLSRVEAVTAIGFIYKLSTNQHLASSQEEANSASFIQSVRAVEIMMNLPWWNRIWTFQEAVLLPKATVVCGSIHIPWTVFETAVVNSGSHNEKCCRFNGSNWRLRGFYFMVSTLKDNRWLQFDGPGVDLLWTLHQLQYRQASDPRDKIYALYGLKNTNRIEASTGVDYSLSVCEVYTNFVLQSIRSTDDLFPLLRISEAEHGSDLPSWVPDWSIAPQDSLGGIGFVPLQVYGYFNASKGACLVYHPSPVSILALQGVIVDQVSAVGSYVQNTLQIPHEKYVEQWKNMIGYDHVKNLSYIGGGTYEDAFWRLLAYDYILLEYAGENPVNLRRTVPTDHEYLLTRVSGAA